MTDDIVVTDEDVDRFLQAASDLGKDDPRGWAHGRDIMQRMELDPSDLLLGNPSDKKANRHGRLYRAVAKHCAGKRYITRKANLYVWVAITPEGEGYLAGG